MRLRPAARARLRLVTGETAYAVVPGAATRRRDTALRTVRRRDRLMVPVAVPVPHRDRAGRPAGLAGDQPAWPR